MRLISLKTVLNKNLSVRRFLRSAFKSLILALKRMQSQGLFDQKIKYGEECPPKNKLNTRDRGDHLEVVGLKNLAKTNNFQQFLAKTSQHEGPQYLHLSCTVARHHIYSRSKYNIAVVSWYTIQYSKYVK